MLTVRKLVEEFNFRIIAGQEGLDKEIEDYSIKRPSAELVGYLTYLTPKRIQVYGRTELGLIQQMEEPARRVNIGNVMVKEVPCIIVTRGLPVPEELIDLANERQIPLLTTERSTTRLFYLLIRYLTNHLAPSTLLHGGLVDVYGVGVLITGESGIDKSEVALELIKNGHLLVADDAIHLIVHLEEWQEGKKYDRLGIDPPATTEILGIDLPKIIVPVRPGRTIATIIEVAVMQNRLRHEKKYPIINL